MKTTMNSKKIVSKLSDAQCRNLYRAIRSESGTVAAEWDAHIACFAKNALEWQSAGVDRELSVAQVWTRVALDMFNSSKAKAIWIEASPETIEWGGFLGGECVGHNWSAGEQAISKMVNSLRGGK